MLLAAMPIYGWKPGPGDSSLANGIIFAGYLAVAFLAWRAARREAARGLDPFPWRVLAVGCVVLALGKQLDLSNAITAVGRQLARSEGWYARRGTVQVGLLAVLALAGGAAAAWVFRRTGPEWRRRRLTWAAFILLVTFSGVRAVSLHDVDRLLLLRPGGIGLNVALELGGLGLLFASAWHAAHQPGPPVDPNPK